MRFILSINILFIFFVSLAASAADSCSINEQQIETRVDDYILAIEERQRANEDLIRESSFASDHTYAQAQQKARDEEAKRRISNVQLRDNSPSCQGRFYDFIMGPVQERCNYDQAENSCPSFNRDKEVSSLLQSADNALRSFTGLNVDSSARECRMLIRGRNSLVNKHDAYYSKRQEVYSKHGEIQSGNSQCQKFIENNIISDSCVDSLNPDVGNSAQIHQGLKGDATLNCNKESMSQLQGSLITALENSARKTCDILTNHQVAVKNERELYNKYKQIDLTINRIDETIIEINRMLKRLSCDTSVASN